MKEGHGDKQSVYVIMWGGGRMRLAEGAEWKEKGFNHPLPPRVAYKLVGIIQRGNGSRE